MRDVPLWSQTPYHQATVAVSHVHHILDMHYGLAAHCRIMMIIIMRTTTTSATTTTTMIMIMVIMMMLQRSNRVQITCNKSIAYHVQYAMCRVVLRGSSAIKYGGVEIGLF